MSNTRLLARSRQVIPIYGQVELNYVGLIEIVMFNARLNHLIKLKLGCLICIRLAKLDQIGIYMNRYD